METKNKFLLLIIILIALGYLGTKEVLAFCSPVDPYDQNSPPFFVGKTTTITETEADKDALDKLCQDKRPTGCGCPEERANYHCEVVQNDKNDKIYEEHWTCVLESQPSPSPGNGESKSTAAYTFETGIPGIAKKGETLPTSGISNLVNKIIVFVFALAGLLSMAMIIYAGVEISISAGNANLQRDAKDRLLWAIVGLIFLFTSYILLYTINPELVRIKEPGLGGNNNAPSNGFNPGGGGGGGGGGSGADGSGSGADGNNNAPHTLLTGFKWPLATPPSRDSITSCYGYRNSEELRKSCGTSHYCLCHQGIDIAQDPNQPVYAVADGTVVDVGQGFKGLDCGPVRITIKHQGQGGTYYSIYCHLGSSSVSKDKQVKAGDQIGTTDNLGHLHIAFGSAPGYGDDTIRIDPACVFGTALTYGIEGVCMSSTPITDYGDCHFPPAGNCDLILGPKK